MTRCPSGCTAGCDCSHDMFEEDVCSQNLASLGPLALTTKGPLDKWLWILETSILSTAMAAGVDIPN